MNIRSKLAAGLSSPFTVRRFVVAALCFLLVSPALAQVARAAVPTAPTWQRACGPAAPSSSAVRTSSFPATCSWTSRPTA